MNQRLLERLKRHSEFPQLRPGVTASGQRGSIEPLSAGQPRLALSKQSSPSARASLSSQPLESELPSGLASFAEPNFSQPSQATQAGALSDADVDVAQGDSAALEDFAADNGSNFSEIPFSSDAQITSTTNTEATISQPLNAALAATATPTLSANSNTDQLEPALTARNPQRSAQPRTAQPVSPIMPNALETQMSVTASSNSASSDSASSANTETSADSRGAGSAPRESSVAQEAAEFAGDDAGFSVSPADTSANMPNAELLSKADAETALPPAESAPDFDRKAAMLELRELGVKVRVTLSNAALKAQLEAVRPTATPETRPAVVAPDANGNTSATSALETGFESDANTTPDRGDVQSQPSTDSAPRASAVTAGTSQPMGASSAERAELEPARSSRASTELRDSPESLNARSAVAGSALENPTSLGTQPRVERSAPLEVNPTVEIIAGQSAEPAVNGTVVGVEVYNPPNRRAAIARPKVIEAPKNEAEVLFSTLPDSNPLEWLNRLNSIQALDADVSKAVNLATQARPLLAQPSPALGNASESPARLSAIPTGATSVNAVRTTAPLLPNLGVSSNPQLESARPTAPVAALGAPEQGSQPSSALIVPPVAGLARSAPTVQPTPTTTQRQAASDGDVVALQTSDQQSAAPVTGREAALGNAASERTARQSAALERSEVQANDLEARDLEIAAIETAAETNAASNFRSLEEGLAQQNGLNPSMPRTATEAASDDRAFEITREPSREARDPSASSNQATSNQATSSLGGRGTDATSPAASETPLVTGASLSAQTAMDQTQSIAVQSDFAVQGTVAAVEVYNPPNRRAAVARPKVIEAPKNEAEVLFSTLPDSNPLEWLSRLNSIQALDTDSSSAPAMAQRSTLSVPLSAGNALQAAPLAARNPTAPDLGPARVAQNAAQTAPRLSVSAPANPAQGLESPMRGSLREPEPSGAEYGAQPQIAQIGGAQSSAPLIATPPSAGALIAALPTNPESPARAAAQPVRLSSSAQRLIAPITGIDPSTVQIRRDAESDALTKAYRADALTVNGTVLLSARLNAETPETLGVIAHELTHVARERQPRFVPPALRQPLIPGSGSSRSSSLEGQGEESIALQVEGFTRALAQQGMALNNTALSSTLGSNGRSANGAASGRSRSLESVPWSDGVLPAPWELADRLEALTNPGLATARRQSAQPAAFQQMGFQQSAAPQAAYTSAFTRSDAPAFAGSSSNSSLPAASSSGGGFGGIGGSNAPMSVQAADQGRSVPTPSPEGPLPKSPEAAPKPASATTPAPDLDDLARQVYAVLKRRLITERRRSS